MRHIVYTEIHENGNIERWYYGVWNDSDAANEVAYRLGNNRSEGIYHCVCDESEASSLGIRNMYS